MEKTLEKKKHSLIYEEQLMEMHIMGKLIMLQERGAEAQHYDIRLSLRNRTIESNGIWKEKRSKQL